MAVPRGMRPAFDAVVAITDAFCDIRYAPRGIQEEALRKGLIPYLPEPRRRAS